MQTGLCNSLANSGSLFQSFFEELSDLLSTKDRHELPTPRSSFCLLLIIVLAIIPQLGMSR